LFTSETELKRNLLWNVCATVFLALFGAIYEKFSHEVYSYHMIYAFAVPLLLGVLPEAVLLLRKRHVGRGALSLWNYGIATLSVGSVFQGALEIYGTTNSLSIVYPIAGGALLLAGVFCYLAPKCADK